MYIIKVTEVLFEIPKTICYKISKWWYYHLDLKNSNSTRNHRIAFNFCSYLKLVSPNFLTFHQNKALKKLWKMLFVSLKLFFWFLQHSNFWKKIEVKNGILPVTYPEQFSYWYTTGMGVQILVPKKWNLTLFTLLFSITNYVSSFLSKVYF